MKFLCRTHSVLLLSLSMLAACASSTSADGPSAASEQSQTKAVVASPTFNADSAYAYVERQLSFGTREPGSVGHEKCGQWLEQALRTAGADEVTVSRGSVDISGTEHEAVQIFGRFNPDAPRRILLLAHWDTRPWADEDINPANQTRPIPGANDGGSGVAVLLEVARQLGLQKPGVGVDILFTDCEDSGSDGDERSWGVGTQWWAANLPYEPGRLPAFGILLDMVGARDAVFPIEYFSNRWAPDACRRVWAEAAKSGFAARFPNRVGGAVTDDHIYLNIAGIPTVDIIECSNPVTGSFHPSWHTMADDLPIIDRATLGVVGQTVLNVIYNYKN